MFDEMRGSNEEESRIRPALEWIVDALNQHSVRYQVIGGLAAKAYGARRRLVDIDIYIPFDEADSLLKEIQPYVIWGPEHYIGDEEIPWDLTFLKIEYGGHRIELADSSSEPKFYDRRRRCWEEQRRLRRLGHCRDLRCQGGHNAPRSNWFDTSRHLVGM